MPTDIQRIYCGFSHLSYCGSKIVLVFYLQREVHNTRSGGAEGAAAPPASSVLLNAWQLKYALYRPIIKIHLSDRVTAVYECSQGECTLVDPHIQLSPV